LKTANSGYLTRRLVDVAQDCIVTEQDCGTENGIELKPVVDGGEVVVSLGERALGRTLAEDIQDPRSGELMYPANTYVDEDIAAEIDESGIQNMRTRSPLTCETVTGICATCYGRDLARGTKVNMGEAVGVIAAQSIGEPGTQLTMRTFHIGGTASVSDKSVIESSNEGTIQYDPEDVIVAGKTYIAKSRKLEFSILNQDGKELETHKVDYGTRVSLKNGAKVARGDRLAEWDPYATPILTEVEGTVRLLDIVDGVSAKEETDEETGISSKVIVDWRAKGGATQRDITGGLPRVAELFEARRPKDDAVIADIDGKIEFTRDYKNKRKIQITPDDEDKDPSSFLIAKGKHMLVSDGDRVKKGDFIIDGNPAPHDILVMGVEALAEYLVDEVQGVYRLQGVPINDKHIEVIVRQMLQKVEVTNPGDTTLLKNEQMDKIEFNKVNAPSGDY